MNHNMEYTINQRLNLLVDFLIEGGYVYNRQDFANKIGKSKTQLSGMLKGAVVISERTVHLISDIFPELNIEWLLTGVGGMLKNDPPAAKINRIKILVHWLISQGIVESQQDLGEKIGITNKSYLSQLVNGRTVSLSFINKLSEMDSRINSDWLLSGEGEMLKGEAAAAEQVPALAAGAEMVPLLPIAAQGGPLNDFVTSVRREDCEKIASPIRGVDFAMSVSGDSMAPEYPSGCKILVKKIDEKAFIEWGRVYVLDTCNGSVVKKIMPGEREGQVRCVSINDDYPPFLVDLVSVYGIYRVQMMLAEK